MKFFILAMFWVTSSCFGESLFNGKDLSKFQEPKNNIWWKADAGVIQCKSGPKKKGSTLWSKVKYENFVVELDFKMISGTVDSGLFIRNNDQIQIGISGSLKRDMTTSPYIPGKGYPKESNGVKGNLKEKGWNTLKVKAIGPIYSVWLNGVKVNEYESSTATDKGSVGLQLHANKEMEIHFKNIEINKV